MSEASNLAPSTPREQVLAEIEASAAVEPGALSRARLAAERTRQPIEQVLNQLGAISDDALVLLYSAVAQCEVWDPDERPIEIDPDALGVSVEYLRRARLAPLSEERGYTLVAACDPLDGEALDGLVFATGRKIKLLAARPGEWRRAFEQAFPSDRAAVVVDERRLEREVDQLADGAGEGQGSRLVAAVCEAAIAARASDIHFEPRRHDLRIRLRIDGQLIDYRVVGADLSSPAVSRIKVVANLNLGERRLPQDGRATFVVGGRPIDVRVATSPTVFGEAAVLRILDRQAVALDLDALELTPQVAGVLRSAAKTPHGLFLVTGPTGSGKTTTLYALLSTFAGSARKVMSVEDPVEYHFDHVSQTQVAPAIGLSFASALRSFLRQDPDVILVGEIRDPETAAVAVQAAMTGHLVLASVHANDAIAVTTRLQDLGVEPYQLAAAFRGSAAQRLVRRLCGCHSWSKPEPADLAFAARHGIALPAKLPRPIGCSQCSGSGFKGRVPIAEAFLADEAMLRLIAEGGARPDLLASAHRQGMASMLHDGLDKVAAGQTALSEVAAAVDA
jgi:type II secretory ATPase GspE/PulE/Tfp pilus assembly ATPase PilB-like protein